ncbi:class I SAM-dependent methyltransferase [Chitinophaga ginsengisegetis]|uniref:class I SAM-dependent methyltransferase n=1 Tax=Chitinophaga ginsengisegetis TaxID=393003 RepID=UPI000DBF8E8D|nr:class I SAM-dependent methyltransferase [Chitinophaga ginsengisegetis]MDR6568307.1 ubiquinone/menaquinone biosynthesis C-methylase UbiE [Chitinophaga ginsengisegetis]MDR6648462.1 ubiquinone/menaquinone biosynthesis C-methylase UbiE [Chitinophaga ginsengisegetis]MDR6654388.1 ubiquinone/menaquinone biosynthesis C-methylase UbiE [Chitinophaga ginsengisegetis]
MDIRDAIALINHTPVTDGAQTVWADLGCGSGLFTYALANLLATGSTIYAWDKARPALSGLPNPHHITIQPGQLDFLKDDIPVSGLNGILMANSLHYVPGKPAFIDKISAHLQENGAFLIVEYETTKANPWVPYPVPFHALKALFHQAGFTSAVKLNERPSLYGSGHMYAAMFSRRMPG